MYVYSNGSQVIERLKGCGSNRVHLMRGVDPSSISLMDSKGRSIGFSFFDQPYLTLIDPSDNILLSYITTSVSWSCYSSAFIATGTSSPRDNSTSFKDQRVVSSPGASSIRFLINAVIQKSSEIAGEVVDADVTVIAKPITESGDTHMMQRSMTSQVMMKASSAESYSNNNTQESDSVWDYKSYHLGQLSLGNRMSIPMLEVDCPAQKMYVHTVPSSGVILGYELSPQTTIPAHRASFHESGTNRYITQTNIKEVQAGNTEIVLLGSTTAVSCKSSISVSEIEPRVRGSSVLAHIRDQEDIRDVVREFVTTREIIHVYLFSSGVEESLLELRYTVDDADVLSSTSEFKKEGSQLRFRYSVTPGESEITIELEVVRRT